MKLKKMEHEEKRIIALCGLFDSLNTLGDYGSFCVNVALENYKKSAYIFCRNFQECVESFYGKNNESENNIEWLLAKILFALSLLIYENNYIYEFFDMEIYGKIQHLPLWKQIKITIKNVKYWINHFMPDYEIIYNENEFPITFKTTKFKAILENLKNIEEKIADPIAQLLEPMKNELELSGLICKIYSEFEKITPKNLEYLNETDKEIYQNVWRFAKQLANKIDGVKGHKSDSQLTIIDIAHNFALSASLIQKYISLNKENSEVKVLNKSL